MKKLLTGIVILGLGIYMYNEYKKAKNAKKPQLK
jgi:hypothetical protein